MRSDNNAIVRPIPDREPDSILGAAIALEPRSARQPASAMMLAPLLLLVLLIIGGTVVMAWSLIDPPIAAQASGRPLKISSITPLPAGSPPAVEPTDLVQIDRNQARVANAAVPFSSAPVVPAIAFSGMIGPDRERAVTCLAAAAYYEAGDDMSGMASVVQVVLNRVRHPAFPASICGVVFQGAERRTGCQFTFTCDGALRRPPIASVWAKARLAAIQGLSGFVDRRVGLSTHYHTDWVLPYWSPKLTKIAQVGTHLFFRWPGPWGELRAFQQRYLGDAVIDPRIAPLAIGEPPGTNAVGATDDAVTGLAAIAGPAQPALSLSSTDLGASTIHGYDNSDANFLVQLDPAAFPGSYAVLAYKLCKDRTPCRVTGWLDAAAMPAGSLMTDAARKRASFFYQRLGPGNETALWNCKQMPRSNKGQCLDGSQPIQQN